MSILEKSNEELVRFLNERKAQFNAYKIGGDSAAVVEIPEEKQPSRALEITVDNTNEAVAEALVETIPVSSETSGSEPLETTAPEVVTKPVIEEIVEETASVTQTDEPLKTTHSTSDDKRLEIEAAIAAVRANIDKIKAKYEETPEVSETPVSVVEPTEPIEPIEPAESSSKPELVIEPSDVTFVEAKPEKEAVTESLDAIIEDELTERMGNSEDAKLDAKAISDATKSINERMKGGFFGRRRRR